MGEVDSPNYGGSVTVHAPMGCTTEHCCLPLLRQLLSLHLQQGNLGGDLLLEARHS